jgi:hypothetical protein
MHHLTLSQFRTTLDTGGILSVALVGQGGSFFIQAETRKGDAVLTKARGSDLREFRDVTKALHLLRELGVREARVDARNWRPEQAELGRPPRPDSAAMMKAAHEAAQHEQWFRAQVQVALDEHQQGIDQPKEAAAVFAELLSTNHAG